MHMTNEASGAGPASAPPALGPGPVNITLTVNGQPHAVTVDPRVTLLDALRERLQLMGTKKGCDRGECGACLLYTSPSPRDRTRSRMPSSA